jgi:hypothetical protein
MNLSLARTAASGVRSGNFETRTGFCLRACRQWAETVYGTRYDRLFRGDGSERDATAARASYRFLASGLAFPAFELEAHGGLQAGDMPVKTKVAPNRFGEDSGHIGVVCEDGRIAENSSTSIGRVRSALGYRSRVQFGAFQLVVRLPDPRQPRVTQSVIEAVTGPVLGPTGAEPKNSDIRSADIKAADSPEALILVRRRDDQWVGERIPTEKKGGHNWAEVRKVLAAAGVEIEQEGKWGDGAVALFLRREDITR